MLGSISRLFITVLLVVFSSSSYSHDVPPTGVASLAPMLENVTPAVVNISVTKVRQVRATQYWGVFPPLENRRGTSAGSGLIVDAENGYVVTNHHVIDEAEKIVVTLLDRREFEAAVVGSDPETDVALLRIDASDLQELDLGNSDELRVGDFVVAIGNPFGFGQTVTSGIVSALGRTGLDSRNFENFIQTDASINPGNSGGPLVDLSGKVIGINTAIIGSEGSIGIGFATPSSMVASVLEQLIEHGQVSRGVLGISIQNVSSQDVDIYRLESLNGAFVTDVVEGSSADRAGLQVKDVIVAIDGVEIADANSLRAQLGLRRVGEIVKVKFVRDGATRNVEAAIADTSDIYRSDQIPQLNGVDLADINSTHSNYRYVQGKGVVVDEIQASSNAYNKGLRKNDIITHLNRVRIGSLREFYDSVQGEDADEIRILRVFRNGRTYPILF
ncbi:MAG: Do family serine endopeptidase [Gammaproteobacteria bacterium]|nr:Do family serine endopeptidase [Gammaproteobacteria bacterium]